MIGRDAFQETDIIGITLPITKHSRLVEDVEELADAVREAFAVAHGGSARAGADRRAEGRAEPEGGVDGRTRRGANGGGRTAGRGGSILHGRELALLEAAPADRAAERPLIMAGHGVILSDAYDELRALAERTGMPVITTLLGISAFPEAHPLHLGMPGMHGEVHVNRAIQQADLIIGVGLRFDDRVTGNIGGASPAARRSSTSSSIRPRSARTCRSRSASWATRARSCARCSTRVAPRDCDAWREEIAGFVRPRCDSFGGELTPEAHPRGTPRRDGRASAPS